jgi:hypothetical protein
MRRTLKASHDAFPLSRPFRISRGVKTVADVITVAILRATEWAAGRRCLTRATARARKARSPA